MCAYESTGRIARIFAVVPAAGRSGRMGRAKPLMPVDGGTMLESVTRPIKAAGAEALVVVTHVDLSFEIARMGHLVLVNLDPESEMIDSVRRGLEWVEQWGKPRAEDGVLVCPTDQPGLRMEDVAACMAAFREEAGRIAIAAYQGRRGHPIIFPWTLAEDVRGAVCDGGLRALPERHAAAVREVEIDNPAAVRNVNTPEDWRELEEVEEDESEEEMNRQEEI